MENENMFDICLETCKIHVLNIWCKKHMLNIWCNFSSSLAIIYLKGPVIFNGPDADAYGDQRKEHQGNEDEDPGMCLRLQIVTGQELKHQQQQVHSCADYHGLELHMAVVFHSTTSEIITLSNWVWKVIF